MRTLFSAECAYFYASGAGPSPPPSDGGGGAVVTGGGGSIGSELCRQIAGHKPKKLIIFDVYENNAYALQLELLDKYPDLDLEVLIGSVRDSRKLNALFAQYRPEVVYHAAAHKHVPLSHRHL